MTKNRLPTLAEWAEVPPHIRAMHPKLSARIGAGPQEEEVSEEKTTSICKDCGEKPLSEFYIYPATGRPHQRCRKCRAEFNRTHYK